MDSGWRSSFNTTTGGHGGDGNGNGNDNGNGERSFDFTTNVWEDNIWDIGGASATTTATTTSTTTCYGCRNHNFFDISTTTVSASAAISSSGVMYPGVGSVDHHNPDPHMMCLRLGKRHYCEGAAFPLLGDRHVATQSSPAKTGRRLPYPCTDMTATAWPPRTPPTASVKITSLPLTAVPRCQVEGCHVALSNAKEYHRRHKVCEFHSKAPKVVVLGLEQRFCQQCSRFHGVEEFDEAKRSCRRRLAGHNERRRKGTLSHSLSRNLSPKSHEKSLMMMTGRYPPLLPLSPPSKTGRAFSLLSSSKTEPWVSPADDFSSRCSAALHELIIENRASSLFNYNQHVFENKLHVLPDKQINWDRFREASTRP